MGSLTSIDLLIAFFSGVGATILGFFLTLFWELKKTKKQEAIIFVALKNELENNKQILLSDLNVIEQELAIVDNHMSVVVPLSLLDSNFASLLSFCVPKKIKTDPLFLSELMMLSRQAKSINESIQSRESYRIGNGAMDNYSRRLKIYDEALSGKIYSYVSLSNATLLKF